MTDEEIETTRDAAAWLRPIAHACYDEGTWSAEVMGWLLMVEIKMTKLLNRTLQ